MAVEQFTGRVQQSIWHASQEVACALLRPAGVRRPLDRSGRAIIAEFCRLAAKVLLERDEPWIGIVGAPEVEQRRTLFLRLLDDFPEEKRCAAEVAKTRIGASV